MTVVIDANLVLRWLLNEDGGEAVAGRIHAHATSAPVVVPQLFHYELTNVLLQAVRRGRMTQSYAEDALAQVRLLPLSPATEPIDQLAVIRIAAALNLPAAYDAQYLALAEELDAELWTGDRRFFETARITYPRMMLV